MPSDLSAFSYSKLKLLQSLYINSRVSKNKMTLVYKIVSLLQFIIKLMLKVLGVLHFMIAH